MTDLTAKAQTLDASDPLARFREEFLVPEGTTYLDGNSLGLMPKSVPARLAQLTDQEWSHTLIRGWTDHQWFDLPITVGNRIAPLIGARHDEVVVGESTSVNLFRCMAAALHLRPTRSVILVENKNFPTDNYMAQGLVDLNERATVVGFDDNNDLESKLNADVAVVVLSQVDYRTAEVRDLASVTAAAHRAGALILWDLSHTTGAVPCDLHNAGADMAVGCTYKYLNGGPGSPAFTWIHPDLIDGVRQPLSGWMGHHDPFAFTKEYEPAAGSRRLVCGTPQVIGLTILDEALKLWSQVDLGALRSKGQQLTSFFIDAVEELCPDGSVAVASPRDPERRGCHVSLHIDEGGFEVMQVLYQRGVVGDFRAPSLMRFGFAPIYLTFAEVLYAAEQLAHTLETGSWRTIKAPIRGPGT